MFTHDENYLYKNGKKFYKLRLEGYTGQIRLEEGGYLEGKSNYIIYLIDKYRHNYGGGVDFELVVLEVKDTVEEIYRIRNCHVMIDSKFLKGESDFLFLSNFGKYIILYKDKTLKKVFVSDQFFGVSWDIQYLKDFSAGTSNIVYKLIRGKYEHQSYIMRWTGKKFENIGDFEGKQVEKIAGNFLITYSDMYRYNGFTIQKVPFNPLKFTYMKLYFKISRRNIIDYITTGNVDTETKENLERYKKKMEEKRLTLDVFKQELFFLDQSYVVRKLIWTEPHKGLNYAGIH